MEFPEFLKKLGAMLRAHRRAIGLTQEEMGEKLNVSTQWISEMERGNGAPSLELLFGMAALMHTTISDLTHIMDGPAADKDALLETVVFLQRQNTDVLQAVATFTGALQRANFPEGRN